MKRIQPLYALIMLLTMTACSKKPVSEGNPVLPPEITAFTPVRGTPGTTVTITGKHFKGSGNAVSFGGVNAAVSSASATEIQVKVPAGAVTGRIRVNTALSAADFLVETAPAENDAAEWRIRHAGLGTAAIFQMGLGFAYKGKLHWGFTRVSVLQTAADHFVFDPAAAKPEWVAQTPPPAQMAPAVMQSATAVALADKVYLGTGLIPAASGKWWRYHPETNTATALADYPENTAGALSFVIDNTLYVGFGGTGKNLYKFAEAGNGSWQLAATGTFRELNGGNAMVLGNAAYIGRASLTPGGPRKTMYRFTPPNSLAQVTDMPDEVVMHATPSFTLGGKGYFVMDKYVWEYTPDATGGTWRKVIGKQDGPAIRHVGVINNVVFGWTGTGAVYEFRLL